MYILQSFDFQLFFWSNKFELRRDLHVLNHMQVLDRAIIIVADYFDFYGSDRASKWIHWQVSFFSTIVLMRLRSAATYKLIFFLIHRK